MVTTVSPLRKKTVEPGSVLSLLEEIRFLHFICFFEIKNSIEIGRQNMERVYVQATAVIK